MTNQRTAGEGTWTRTCTTLDHVYPVTKFGKPCYCGARVWGGRNLPRAQKVVDTATEPVVELPLVTEPPRGAAPNTTEAAVLLGTAAPQPKDKTVQLTLKGLSKNGKVALYTGAANVLRIPVGAFGGNEAPATIDVSGVAEKPAKVEKVKLTPEERKAARAAKPKPTLAEKAAAARKRAEALEAKAAAEVAL